MAPNLAIHAGIGRIHTHIPGAHAFSQVAFTAWHGYYFSKQYQSWKVLLNIVHSLKSRFFNRDISRF